MTLYNGDIGVEGLIHGHFKSLEMPLEDLKKWHLNPIGYGGPSKQEKPDIGRTAKSEKVVEAQTEELFDPKLIIKHDALDRGDLSSFKMTDILNQEEI